MRIFILLSGLLGASMCLTGCAPMLAFAGYGGSVVQIAAQVERVKLVGDGVSYVGSGKTITDHALSMAMRADCKLFNVVMGEPVCVNRTVEAVADTDPIVTAAAAGEPLARAAAQASRAIDNEDFASAPSASSGGE